MYIRLDLLKKLAVVVLTLWLSLSAFLSYAAQLPDFTKLVEKASPAVVNITATRETREQVPEEFEHREIPDFFRHFFRNYPAPTPQPSAGSGFIISSDGYILTNNHVVEGADSIIVALADRREREAVLVGADELSDLALLKIDEKNLPSVEIGQSSQLKPGEWVLAIGSPFGFEYSVTAGIVSAMGRSLPDSSASYVPFIQTDVAINPGNSGGPLFNLDGKVVGINSQIFTRSGGFMGLSFAIPIDVALDVVRQLKDKGSVARGWLGVLIQRVDRDLAESFSLDRPAGALISQVLPGSPAEEAGLREGDIIVEFDGKKIDLSSELPQVVGRIPPNTEVNVLFVREGQKKSIKLRVGLLQETERTLLGGLQQSGSNQLGMDVRGLTDDDKSRFGATSGVIVTRVFAGPAAQAGIQQGDVLTMIDSERITSVRSFEEKVAGLKKEVAISIRVVRNGSPMFLVIKIPAD